MADTGEGGHCLSSVPLCSLKHCTTERGKQTPSVYVSALASYLAHNPKPSRKCYSLQDEGDQRDLPQVALTKGKMLTN